MQKMVKHLTAELVPAGPLYIRRPPHHPKRASTVLTRQSRENRWTRCAVKYITPVWENTMTENISIIRRKIRAILDDKRGPVIELSRISDGDINLETVLQAAVAERKAEKDLVRKSMLTNLITRIYLDTNQYVKAEKEALEIAEEKEIPNALRAYACYVIAVVYIRKEDYDRTEAFCKKALALIEEHDSSVLPYILNVVGKVYLCKEKYETALEYYQAFRNASEKIGNQNQLVTALHNISVALHLLGREDEFLEYSAQARNIALKTGEKLGLAYILNLSGESCLYMGKLKRALAEGQEALEIFKAMSVKWMFADCHIEIARIRLEMGQTDTAAEHAAKALAYAEELEQKKYLPRVHEVMGLVLSAQDNPLAETHFLKSIELYQKLKPDGNAEGIEFAMLGYGKQLLARNNPEGGAYIAKAAEILKKKPPMGRVRKAREELKRIEESFPDKMRPSLEEQVRKIEKDRDNISKVLEITKTINSESEAGAVFEHIIDAAIGTSNAERGFILLLEGKKWNFAAQKNFFGDITSEPDYPVMREIIMNAISTGTDFTAGNIRDPKSLGASISKSPSTLKGILVFPLAIRRKVIGAVYLDSRFAVLDLPLEATDFLHILMEHLALIVEKTRLYEDVRKLSEELGEKLEQTQFDLEEKHKELDLRYSYKNIIGKSPGMQELFRLLDKVIETDLPVYIHGKSGTGKELVAKAIHYNGPRSKKHFVALNCAAVPDTLLESELFGYEKGAFTGADAQMKGLFEIADKGTFLFDEIGNMSKTMQQKLLRVLQEKEIRRIGGKEPVKIDVRIISASNRNPRQLIETGKLREDLFYRLNVLTIELPPIRERKEDIPFLVRHFWEKATGSPPRDSSEDMREFLRALMDYDWPGNVRELENEIFRLATVGDGTLNPRYLSKHILKDSADGPVPDGNMRIHTRNTEKSLIKSALQKTKGNKSTAAKILGITRSTLRYKIKKYWI
jgi:transcriptional regulator with GAF, ATPase, and Fis domain